MAGTYRPDVGLLSTNVEGTWFIHDYVLYDPAEYLFNGDNTINNADPFVGTYSRTTIGIGTWPTGNYWLDITIDQASDIWAYPYQNAGYTLELNIYENPDGVKGALVYTTNNTTGSGGWYKLIPSLPAGRYRIESSAIGSSYHIDYEWFIEALVNYPLTAKEVTLPAYDLSMDLGISSVTVTDSTGVVADTTVKYAVSFDNGVTYKAWVTDAWVTCTDLEVNGMDKATFEGVTESQWDSIFVAGNMLVKASLKTTSPSATPYIDNIDVNTVTRYITGSYYLTSGNGIQINTVDWDDITNVAITQTTHSYIQEDTNIEFNTADVGDYTLEDNLKINLVGDKASLVDNSGYPIDQGYTVETPNEPTTRGSIVGVTVTDNSTTIANVDVNASVTEEGNLAGGDKWATASLDDYIQSITEV